MNSQATKVLVFVALVSLFGLAFSAPVRAQVSGATLNGLVTDAQGGAVVGAKVSAKNSGTGAVVETIANSAGAYTLPNLNPADYEISVSATGFKTVISKVTLAVGQKQEMNIGLTVGDVAQTVEVTAAAPQIDLASSTITDEVTQTSVRELPLNGRDWASLATLQPGVLLTRTQRTDPTQVGGAGGRGFGDQLSIAGARPQQNSYRLDGAVVNDYSNGGPGSVLGANLGVDAIQEFSVITSNFSAEYGYTSGGVINAVTKSGTNSFHGSAFEFLRNDKFDSNDFFSHITGVSKPPLRQNQFGASGGYKVWKDRVFMFGSYEGVRKVKGVPSPTQGTISDSVRAGTVTNLTTGTTTTVAVDPNIAKFLPLYPEPTPGLTCFKVTVVGALNGLCNPDVQPFAWLETERSTENFFTSRTDVKLTSKDNLFFTYLRDPSITTANVLALDDDIESFSSYRQILVAEETHVFSPSLVNTVRGAYDNTNNLGGNTPSCVNPVACDKTLSMFPATGAYGTPGLTPGVGSPLTNIAPGVIGGTSIQDFYGQLRQVYDDVFLSRGTHGLKFGFAFIAYQDNAYLPLAGWNGTGTWSANGIYNVNFPNAGNAGNVATPQEAPCLKQGQAATTANLQNGTKMDTSCGAFVNFLTNQPSAGTRPLDPTKFFKHYLRDKIPAAYIQDDWRFRSNLTVNLGLRYEMSTIPTETTGKVAILPTLTTLLPCDALPLPVVPNAQVGTPDQTCPTVSPVSATRNSFWSHNPTLWNFEPRIGFAWDPFKDGKTSVRGGAGLFDSLPLPYQLVQNNSSAAPYRPSYVALGQASGVASSPPSIAGCANASINEPCAANAQGEWPFVIPSLQTQQNFTPSGYGGGWMYVDANIKRNLVMQYNLNVQRQLTPTLSFLVGYVGSRAWHNPFQVDSGNMILPVDLGNAAQIASVGYYWPTPYISSLTAAQKTQRNYNPELGGVFATFYEARSWYNSLLVKVVKKMDHGFQVQGSFTWSKSIDDSSGSYAGDTFAQDPVTSPWWALNLDKGLSDFNVARNLVINGLWDPPAPKSLGVVGEKVLGGWQLGIIFSAATGAAQRVINSADMVGSNIGLAQSPNFNPTAAGCTATSPQNLVNANWTSTLLYIQTSCLGLPPLTAANASICDNGAANLRSLPATGPFAFSTVCPNIYGNLGRDTITGPGLVNTDFSLFKNNYVRKISETFNVQFRAEFFNVLNHKNFAAISAANTALFSSVNGTVNPQFGQLTSTQGTDREIQLALKVVW